MENLDTFPLTVDLTITAEDILKGNYEEPWECPIAVAAEKLFNLPACECIFKLYVGTVYGSMAVYTHTTYMEKDYNYDFKIAQHMPPEQGIRMIVLTRIN